MNDLRIRIDTSRCIRDDRYIDKLQSNQEQPMSRVQLASTWRTSTGDRLLHEALRHGAAKVRPGYANFAVGEPSPEADPDRR